MKKRKTAWWTTVFTTLTLLAHGAFGEDWHCRNGKIYTDVHYMRHNLSAVQFSHSAGISIEKFTNLPDDIQERYGYDPQKVEQARLQHQKQLEEQQAEILKKKKFECIEVQRDEFKDRTIICLKEGLELDNNHSFSAAPHLIVGVDIISLAFISTRPTSLGWRFARSHQVYFLIDGERWHPQEDYNSDIVTKSNILCESINFWIPVERLESIIHAQSVRFQIGGEEFKFTKEHQEKLGVFLEYLHENCDMEAIIQKQKTIFGFIEKTQKIEKVLFP